jgi:hypothetical protein
MLFFSKNLICMFLCVDKTSIQNVMNTTRIFINSDIPEFDAFKNRLV